MNETQQQFASMLDDFEDGMLVTRDHGGLMYGRPMRILKKEDDGTVWFLTDRDAGKVDDLQEDSRVCVTMQASDRFLAITGLADLIDDRQQLREIWHPAMRLWFPDGVESEHLVAIRVQPVSAEYWNNAGLVRKLKFARDVVKAVMSNGRVESNDDDQHGRVEFS